MMKKTNRWSAHVVAMVVVCSGILTAQTRSFTYPQPRKGDTVDIDPNQLSPDGSIALSAIDPAPDGQHFAYGQAEGGSDWSIL